MAKRPSSRRKGATHAAPAPSDDGAWFVYVLECGDGSLYCGIARDVAARFLQHERGKGARYTRGRGPLRVAGKARCRTKGEALRVEYALKQLDRSDKLALIAKPTGVASFVRRWRSAKRAVD